MIPSRLPHGLVPTLVRRLTCLTALLLFQAWTARAASFTPIPDVAIAEDSGAIDIPVELDPTPLPGSDYTFEVEAANTSLLPPGSLLILGSPPRATLRIHTAPDAFGTSLILLRARAAGGGDPVTTSFHLVVRAVDDPPQIKPVPNQVLTEGIPLLRVPIEVSDLDSGFQIAAIMSSNNSLVRAFTENSGGRWFVTLRPAERPSGLPGRATVTVTGLSGNRTNAISFFVTVLPRDFQSAQRLTGVPQWGTLLSPNSVISSRIDWVDVDRDGFPDAVLPGTRQIVLNPRSPIPPVRMNYGTPNQTGYVGTIWTDLNGDGSLDSCAWRPGVMDLLLTRLVQGKATIVRNTNTLPSLVVGGAVFADLDGNGTQDLVYTGVTNEIRRVVTALNDGAATLTVVSNSLPALSGPVVAADFNRDGRTDLLFCESGRRGFSSQVFYNLGGLSFAPGPKVSDLDPVTSAGTIDMNGDGRPDLWIVQAVNGNLTTLELRLLQQEGGQFVEVLRIPADEFRGLSAPSWGDFNHDGLVDFIASSGQPLPLLNGTLGSTNLIMLYQNQGGGRFEPTRFLFPMPPNLSFPSGTANSFVPSAADLDQDGDLDIVGYDLAYRPFYNQQSTPNIPPDMPDGLQAFVVGDDLYLFWNGARDANQKTPLTFNVRVGTSPGGNELVPSNSLSDGTRMIPQTGNAGYASFHTVRLPRRDLDVIFCSVQAVDASFSGGPFAPEVRLQVDIPGNQAPVIQAPAEVVLNEDQQTTVRFTVSDDRTREQDLDVTARFESAELFDTLTLPVARVGQPDGTFRREFTLVPMPDRFGETAVRIVARDRNNGITTNRVAVVVRPVNDNPKITVNLTGLNHLGETVTGTISLSDKETLPQDLRVTLESSNPGLLPPERVAITGTGETRTLTAQPLGSQEGSVTLTLRAIDPDGGTGVVSTVITWQRHLLEADASFEWAAELLDATWVDFNGDGRLDVVGHRSSGVVEVWTRGTDGTFQRSSSINTGAALGRVLIGDMDGDGDADLVAARHYPEDITGDLYILWNEHGSLDRMTTLVPSSFFVTEALLDVDGDGDLDLVVGVDGGELRLLRNAPGAFRGPIIPSWEPLPISNPALLQNQGSFRPLLSTGDVDHDGRTDLHVERSVDGRATVHRVLVQSEPGTFQVIQPNWREGSVLVGSGDFDNDGREQTLLRNDLGLTSSPILIASTFQLPQAIPLNATSPPLGDIDGDGYTDVLGIVQNPAGGFGLVSRVGGSPVFLPQRLPTNQLDRASAGDGDHDGTLQVWVRTPSGSQLLRNSGAVSNQPPSVPANLAIRQVEQGVLELTWSPSTDAEQAGGLTYNVRLGTASGSNDIVSALALPSGQALVPISGNAGGRTVFRVRGAELGLTYYASVQAVDAGFARSAFAPEVSLKVSGLPTVSALSNVTLPRDAGAQQVSFTVGDEETAANQLQVIVESSNPVLLPASRLHLSGSDAGRVLEFQTKPDRAGAATVHIRVTDAAGNTVERSFEVYVPTPTPYAVEVERTLEVPNNAATVLHLDAFDPDGDFLAYQILTGPERGQIEGTGPQVTYHPDPGFEGEVSLSFLASTPGSFPASGRVVLKVVPSFRIRPEVRLTRIGSDPAPRLVVRGRSGATVHLEHSVDLRQWEGRGDLQLPASEVLLLEPSETGPSSAHFFRVVTGQ